MDQDANGNVNFVDIAGGTTTDPNFAPQPLQLGSACPHCGYCPHCGRVNYQPPQWPYPFTPWYVSTGSVHTPPRTISIN